MSRENWKIAEIDGQPVYKYRVQVKAVTDENKDLYTKCNFVIFKNAGNGDIILDGGWTLNPGETLSLGSMEIKPLMEERWITWFDLDTVPDEEDPIYRLERIEIMLPHPELTKNAV